MGLSSRERDLWLNLRRLEEEHKRELERLCVRLQRSAHPRRCDNVGVPPFLCSQCRKFYGLVHVVMWYTYELLREYLGCTDGSRIVYSLLVLRKLLIPLRTRYPVHFRLLGRVASVVHRCELYRVALRTLSARSGPISK